MEIGAFCKVFSSVFIHLFLNSWKSQQSIHVSRRFFGKYTGKFDLEGNLFLLYNL